MTNGYEQWEEYYKDHRTDELPWELGKPRGYLVRLVEGGTLKAGRALDLCCGAGTNSIYLAENGFRVSGIDISPTAVEISTTRASDAKVDAEYRVQNFLELPFADEEFDFVFDMGCFHHVRQEDRKRFLDGVHRVLKKGGSYLVYCFSYKNGPAWNHFTEKQLVDIFSELFEISGIKHESSVEGDGVIRYFYSVLMEK